MTVDLEFEGRVFSTKCRVKGKEYKQYKLYIPTIIGKQLEGKKVKLKITGVIEDGENQG